MAPDDDRPDPKPAAEPTVKDLLAGAPLASVPDAATQQELERWFGLPSFDQLAERGVELPEDPALVELRERRARAAASVDPALLEALHLRNEVAPETLIKFEVRIESRVKPEMGSFDRAMAERGHRIAEPREVEIPEVLRDELKEVVPQALLRDLHRPELTFDKTFEVVDIAAEQRLDIVAEVGSAMSTSWKLPPLDRSPFEQVRRELAADRELRRRPWIELPMPNRRVTE